MSIIELTVDRFLDENDEGPLYGVRFLITRAVGIPPELFVYRTDTAQYCCVASPTDLLDLTTDQAAAQALFHEFYRSNKVEQRVTNKRRAATFDRDLRVRLDQAVFDWDADDHLAWTRTDLLVLNTD